LVELIFHQTIEGIDYYLPYFLDYVPPKHDGSKQYWIERFKPWGEKINEARMSMRDLVFKDYIYSGSVNATLPASSVPTDGLVVHCPFGSYQCYWKDYHTSDIVVQQLDGQYCHVDAVGTRTTVVDPRHYFVDTHIYECIWDGTAFSILNRRVDKLEAGEPIFVTNNFNLERDNEYLLFHNVRIHYPEQTLANFLRNYGRNYRKTIRGLSVLPISVSDLRRLRDNLYLRVKPLLEQDNSGQLFITTEKLVLNLTNISNTDSVKLWSNLADRGFIKTCPFNPDVRLVKGVLKCIAIFPPEAINPNLNVVEAEQFKRISDIGDDLSRRQMTEERLVDLVNDPEKYLQSLYAKFGAKPFVLRIVSYQAREQFKLSCEFTGYLAYMPGTNNVTRRRVVVEFIHKFYCETWLPLDKPMDIKQVVSDLIVYD
jgi:hypothetical protein